MPTVSTLAWPENVPDDMAVNGFQSGGPEGAVNFQVEDGPSKRRPRVSKISTWYTYSIELTIAQWLVLDRFYDLDTARGSLTFAKRDVLSGEMRDWQFKARPSATALAGLVILATIQICSVP